MGLEDKHLDLLQNIEAGIITVYREDQNLRDLDAIKALEALVKYYTQKKSGKTPDEPDLEGLEMDVFESVQNMLSIRDQIINPAEPPKRPSFSRALRQPSREEIVLACLRKIEKSAKRWNKRNGPQGYLQFIKDYA